MRHKLNAAQLEWLNKWFEPSEIDSADWVVYSYKDWLEGQSMGPLFTTTPEIAAHYLDETKTKRKKGEGKLTVWLLPESEWLRIQQRKQSFLDKLVEVHLNILIESFERRYAGSLEREKLVADELEIIERLTKGELPLRTNGYVYSTRGALPVLGFRNDGKESQRIDHWYNRICVNGEDANQYVSPCYITQPESMVWETDYPVGLMAGALAFRQFKAYLSKRLPIQLTFEDWQSGNWPEWAKRLTGNYAGMHKDANGDYRHYSLSNSEYQKIAAAQKAIFEKQVDLSLQVLINDFEQRFSESRATEILLTSELQKVNQWMTDKDFGEPCILPTPNGGITVFSDWRELTGKKNEDANKFPYWFNELIVQGRDAYTYIEAQHERMKMLIYPIALHVLYRYEQFLKNRLTAAEPSVKEVEKPNLTANAAKYLSILGGRNMYGRIIMDDADYQRVRGYVEAMIEKGGLPDGLEPVAQVDLPNGHIRYLFRCIYAEQYAARETQDHFINFIHAVFAQFEGKPKTTKKKFSVMPPTWEKDLETINR